MISKVNHFMETLLTVYDRRCPPVRPGQIGTCGTCPPIVALLVTYAVETDVVLNAFESHLIQVLN